jgi:arylsulfatase A-like enzyme
MIASVDESVGRVLNTLDDLKLADKTIVIFTSDNGGVGGYGRPEGLIREPGMEGKAAKPKAGDNDGGGITDNSPLRSGKGSLYEGGVRVPFIIRWPGVTRAGSACDVPTIHLDIYPTMLKLTGAPPPRHVLDGESLVNLFREPSAKLRRDAIFQHFPGYLGSGPGLWRTTPVTLMQSGDWKLLEYLEDGKLELYNLRDDLGETKNLAKEMPDKARELHARMVAWRKEVNAPLPVKNQPGAAPAPAKKGNRKQQAQ